MPRIYFDHAATTPVHPAVVAAMEPCFGEQFGNASSGHKLGREARGAVDHARQQVARLLGAQFDEIVFTSGGTEADNIALIGVALKHRERGRHLVITRIEHHAVLHSARFLESQGFEVTCVPVDHQCRVAPDEVARALRDDTVLVSVVLANNEVGALQPIAEIAELTSARGVPLHTDAVQATGAIPVDVNELGVDLLSLAAHKFYGPKGVGALFIRRGVQMIPWMYGGEQERGRRSGTENVPGIVGLGAACEVAQCERDEAAKRIRALRDRLESGLLAQIDGASVNGAEVPRLPGHCNICLPGAGNEALSMNLDLAGIAVSTGSACASGAIEPSHVLVAMGRPRDEALASVRFSLGRWTTEAEVARVVEAVVEIASRLRRMSTRP